MEIQKKWAMPSGDTFGIKPIKELFDKYHLQRIASSEQFAMT
mgnify:CR=1 FL=1